MSLNEAIELLKSYRIAKPYIQFKIFVESLKRTNNSTLIESISKGISTIIEGELHNEWRGRIKFTAPQAEELNTAVQNKDNSKIMSLIYPVLIQEADSKYPTNLDRAEDYLTNLINYYSEHSDIISNYDPKYAPYTFIKNFIIRPEWAIYKNKIGRHESETEAHRNAKVRFNKENQDKVKPDGSNKQGKIINDSAGNGTVEVEWEGKRGRKGNYIVKPYTEKVPLDELDVYDIQTTGFTTQSENTPYMNSKGGSPEDIGTLEDTRTFEDKSHRINEEHTELSKKFKESIKEAAEDVAEDDNSDTDKIEQYLNKRLDIIELNERRKELLWRKTRLSQGLSKVKREKNPELQIELEKVTKEFDSLQNYKSIKSASEQAATELQLDTKITKDAWNTLLTYIKNEPEIINLVNRFKQSSEMEKRAKEKGYTLK